MISVEIFINESWVPPQIVLPFFQKIPDPDGLIYNLEIQFESPSKLKKIIHIYNLKNIEEANSSIFFLYLAAFWPQKKTDELVKYFINSVNEIIIKEISIKLKGVATRNLDLPNLQSRKEGN